MALLEIKTVEAILHVDIAAVSEVEKMKRIHQELDLNMGGIDMVLNHLK